jgi:hypothetical protein
MKVERLNPSQVQVIVDPHPEPGFEKEFKAYLNLDVKIAKHYEDWSIRDPKYFAPIAKPLLGIRCLR